MRTNKPAKLKNHHLTFVVLGFVFALLLFGVVINMAAVGVGFLFGLNENLVSLSSLAAVVVLLAWLIMILRAITRAVNVRAGGALLARRFGAVHASDRSRYELEQRLISLVAEISLASGIPQPEVYILRNDSSINAFSLGRISLRDDADHCAIVVTQGALDSFNKDELRSVVAHEFGHMHNGDLSLNMALLIARSGLMAIDELGRILISGASKNSIISASVLGGYALIGLGITGVYLSELLSWLGSRRRENLADSSAVLFTRNPYALASALNVIAKSEKKTVLQGVYAKELSFLCFQPFKLKRQIKQPLAIRACVQSRIDSIDPNFYQKHEKARKARGNVRFREATDGEGKWNFPVSTVSVGTPLGPLSDGVFILLSEQQNSVAALFAIFASKDFDERRDYLNAIAFAFSPAFSARVKEFLRIMSDELQTKKLAVIERAVDVLNDNLNIEERQQLLLKLESLLGVAGDSNLLVCASLQLVRAKLGVEFPVVKNLVEHHYAQERHVKTFEAMGNEFALLLSLVVESSGASQVVQEQEFERVLKCYTSSKYPRRSGNETGIVDEVAEAFQTLYVQPKPVREAFVQHCIEIMQQSGGMADHERAFLDLFAASLGCQQAAA